MGRLTDHDDFLALRPFFRIVEEALTGMVDGAIIGAHDLWIAATALAHGLTVVTSNAGEFERVPGLTVLAM